MTDPVLSMLTIPLTLGEAIAYTTWWKALLFVLPFAPWGYVVARVFDKDAAQWYLKREQWNMMHLLMGTLALAVVALLPMVAPLDIFVTLPIAVVILVADLLVYPIMRNKDSRVPEGKVWTMQTAVAALLAGGPADDSGKGKKGKGKGKDKKAKGVAVQFRGPNGKLEVPEDVESPQYQARIAAEEVYLQAIDARASRLEIVPVPQQKGVHAAVVTVDGVRQPVAKLNAEQAAIVIDFFKLAAGLDIEDRRRKLKGEIEAGPVGTSDHVEIAVISIGTPQGQKLSLVFEPEKQVSIKRDALGLHDKQMQDLRGLIEAKGGVVLVAAPAGQGRTTTLYNVVKMHDAYTSNVQTVEIEPQGVLEGVTTNLWDAQNPEQEYSTLLRTILRRDPDVVGVSDMVDAETAKTIAKADLERSRVYLSINAPGAMEALDIYLRAVGDPKLAAQWLSGVVAQKLVRRLCNNCKTPYKPSKDLLRQLGLPADTPQLFKKSGEVIIKEREEECPVCRGTGYLGQIGAFAVHHFGPEEQKLIASGDLTSLRGLLRQNKQMSLQSAALAHVHAGTTSIEEVQRVMTPPAKPKAKPAKEQAKA